MMKKTFIIIGVLVCIVAFPFRSMLIEALTVTTAPIENVREGDVIFQTSQSQQSPLIKIGTRSTITHCGIIVMRNGQPYVLETLRTLVLTPLDKFVARGKGCKYWLKRPKEENIKIKYAHYLGKPYDLEFKFDNGKFYCSELIYDIYKHQLGIELCEPKTVDDFLNLGAGNHPKLRQAMKERGITMEQYVVAPVDVFKSRHLKRVKQQRPTSSHGKVILHSFMYPRTSSSIARNAWLYGVLAISSRNRPHTYANQNNQIPSE